MPLPPNLFCGTSGWSYPHWNGIVYPKARRTEHALESMATLFDTLEINTTFYQNVRPEVTAVWAHKVAHAPKFQFTAKLHRAFTHERSLDGAAIARWKEGLWPLMRAKRLGCVLMQFPWTFRYTEENRAYLIRLRRAFHEFPLVAEMRNSTWTAEEALGTLTDYRVGFCNIDQAPYAKATPPTAHLTTDIAYVRLHGRNPRDWQQEFQRQAAPAGPAHDYLYAPAELDEWKRRIDAVAPFATRTFVQFNNEICGKSVVNALQMSALLGDGRRNAPETLLARYGRELEGFRSHNPRQATLFERAVA